MKNVVYLNGEFIDSSEAKVSIFDSGFFYGDGVYEVLLLKDRKIVQVAEHLKRLSNTCQAVNFEYKGESFFKDIIVKLIEKNPHIHTAMIYIQITRGIKEDRYKPFLEMNKNTIVLYLKEVVIDYNLCKKKTLSAFLMFNNRRWNCDIKMTSLLPAVLARIQAEKEGLDYVIFKSRETQAILEGVTSNLFMVNKNDEILTHPLNHELLHGCTRNALINEFKKINLPIKEELFLEEDLLNAKEVFVTGSIKIVSAIASINGKIIGNGQVGEKTKLAVDLYAQIIENSKNYLDFL